MCILPNPVFIGSLETHRNKKRTSLVFMSGSHFLFLPIITPKNVLFKYFFAIDIFFQ